MEQNREFLVENGVLRRYLGSRRSVTIPDGIAVIGKTAFLECINMEQVTIPGSVKTIDRDAFCACVNLKQAVLEEGVESLGEYAFCACRSLCRVSLPESLRTIGSFAFAGCADLKEIHIPAGVTKLGDMAFTRCRGLRDARGFVVVEGILFDYEGRAKCLCVPPHVTAVAEGALRSRNHLERVLLPDSVKSIGRHAFYDCSELKTVEVYSVPDEDASGTGPNRFRPSGLGVSAFDRCPKLTHAALPGGITVMEKGGFAFCSKLTHVQLPHCLERLGEGAFAFGSSLTRVQLPGKVTALGKGVFRDARSLREVELPAGIKELGAGVFEGCSALIRISMPGGAPQPEVTQGNLDSCIALYLYGSRMMQGEAARACRAGIMQQRQALLAQVLERECAGALARLLDAWEGLQRREVDAILERVSSLDNVELTALLLQRRHELDGEAEEGLL